MKSKDHLGYSWNITLTNIHTIGTPEEEKERDKREEILFEELMVENFHNLRKETDVHFQEAQKVPNKMNLKRHTRR